MPESSVIDVIIPVYRGVQETRRCIESVRDSVQGMSFELVLVNDCSPDPDVKEYLATLASRPQLTLLENETNLGFVKSVNRGMSLHPGRDVVLLNSDTEVAGDWLDRLHRCAYRQADIGTVTPFSNNATICSYPFEGWTGGVPGTLGLMALDRLFAATNAGRSVDLPTAVGFCMYIRRACLDSVGFFDELRFGRGYGEENDFCRRAVEVGWRNVLAADVFVHHEGGVSFSEERHALQEAAMAALLDAHPDYLDRVREFIARDPAAPLRLAVDNARSAAGAEEAARVAAERAMRPGGHRTTAHRREARPTQLHITHSWGGGTGRWLRDFCKADGERRNLVLHSRTSPNAAGFRLELLEPAATESPMAAWDLAAPIRATDVSHPEYREILREVVATFGIRAIVVSSLIGHAFDALDTGLPTAVVLHDLYPFCPALFACFGASCTQCEPDTLQACMRTNPYNVFWHNTSADEWIALRREYAARILQPWINVVCPTQSVRDRWTRLLPAMAEKPWHRVEHGLPEEFLSNLDDRPAAPPTAKLRIVVPGRLAPHKGLHLLHEVLPELLQGADLLLLGCGDFGEVFRNTPGVQVIPEYAYAELGDQVRRFAPDCALLLSVLPESFSYTLSEMLALGVPVLATRLGAFDERIEPGRTGLLFEPEARSLMACIRGVAADRAVLREIAARLAALPRRSAADMVRDYHALLPAAPGEATGVLLSGLAEAARTRDALVSDYAWLRGQTDRQNELITARTDEARILGKRVSELEDAISELAAAHQTIRHSRSWRITAPLRAMATAARRLKAAPRGAPSPQRPLVKPEPPATRDVGDTLEQRVSAILAAEDAGARERIRREVRGSLWLPDAARIVFGFGPSGSTVAAARLVQVASACTTARNDVCFILYGSTMNGTDWGEWWDTMAKMVSTRHLFLVGGEIRPELWLLAADAFVSASGTENNLAALKAGLLVLAFDVDSRTNTIPERGQLELLSDADISRSARILSNWLDMPEESRALINDGTRACPEPRYR